jgi:thiamine pyrophosphate-dependent acetolactate synthase large subunit-like protein
VGLGLALAQPRRRVIVATGDGEMLMALGALATIGAQKVRNLSLVVMDNELYSETGMQPTHTSRGVDLAGMAKAAGFAKTGTVYNLKQLQPWIARLHQAEGPVFLAAKITSQRYPMSIRYRDGTAIKNRFRENLLGFDKAHY